MRRHTNGILLHRSSHSRPPSVITCLPQPSAFIARTANGARRVNHQAAVERHETLPGGISGSGVSGRKKGATSSGGRASGIRVALELLREAYGRIWYAGLDENLQGMANNRRKPAHRFRSTLIAVA
jgi:hypothetical protein